MAGIDIQSLDLLFNCLGNLSSTIFWARTADLSQQLYVSNSYETLYGNQCEQLYNHPNTWSNTILCAERDEILERLRQRTISQIEGKDDHEPVLYRIELASGQHNFIKNNSFPLRNSDGSILAFIGLSESILEGEWAKLKSGTNLESIAKTKKFISDMSSLLIRDLSQDPKVVAKAISNPEPQPTTLESLKIQLSRRERECLSLLLQGNSAKQTGKILKLSPRTIESYLEAIKRKFDCRTKFEIISKLQLQLIEL